MRSLIVERLAAHGIPAWLVPDYWFMLTTAILASSILTLYVWRRSGHPIRLAADLLFWGILGLFVGARVFFYLQYGFPRSASAWIGGDGFALYGGLFGLLFAWGAYHLFRPFDALAFLDHVTPALALGLGIGRIGCFLAGCNGGIPASLPWSVQFPAGTSAFEFQVNRGLISASAPLALPAHPTQLYESAFGWIAFLLLLLILRVHTQAGTTFFTGMLWYGAYRFGSEFLRADAGGVRPFGLVTFSQAESILLILASASFLLFRFHQLNRQSLNPVPPPID